MKVRQIAKDAGKTEQAMKAELLPQLLHALSASKAWTVEAPPPGSKCVAILAMRFQGRNNVTRKVSANKKNSTRRWNRSASPQKRSVASPKTAKSANRTKSPNNMTKKAPKNHSALEGEALLRKARALLNLMSAATVDRLSKEFATLAPRTVTDSEALMNVIVEIAMDQQAYHPLVIHLLHVLDSQHVSRPYHDLPSKVVGERVLARAMEEPVFAKMEVAAEEANSPNKNLDDKVRLQKRFFRSAMLLVGFLYRDGFLPWASYKRLVRHFASMALEMDAGDAGDLDYRIYDGYVQGLLYTLIRGGARMVAEGGEAAEMFAGILKGVERVAKEAKRGYIRTDAQEFLDAVATGFQIKPGMTWTVGAPLTDIRVRKASAPKGPAAMAPAAMTAVGLGADIGELWRRFPLDVKQEGDLYVVRFHNKKLRERYEKEGVRHKSLSDLEEALRKQILGLIDASAHWTRGPSIPGTLITVRRKV